MKIKKSFYTVAILFLAFFMTSCETVFKTNDIVHSPQPSQDEVCEEQSSNNVVLEPLFEVASATYYFYGYEFFKEAEQYFKSGDERFGTLRYLLSYMPEEGDFPDRTVTLFGKEYDLSYECTESHDGHAWNGDDFEYMANTGIALDRYRFTEYYSKEKDHIVCNFYRHNGQLYWFSLPTEEVKEGIPSATDITKEQAEAYAKDILNELDVDLGGLEMAYLEYENNDDKTVRFTNTADQILNEQYSVSFRQTGEDDSEFITVVLDRPYVEGVPALDSVIRAPEYEDEVKKAILDTLRADLKDKEYFEKLEIKAVATHPCSDGTIMASAFLRYTGEKKVDVEFDGDLVVCLTVDPAQS